jgi:hypothetical protein
MVSLLEYTPIESEYKPSGQIAGITEIVSKAGRGENVTGNVFDSVIGFVADGLVGRIAGESVNVTIEPFEIFTAEDGFTSATDLLAADNPRVNGVVNYRAAPPVWGEPVGAGGGGGGGGGGVFCFRSNGQVTSAGLVEHLVPIEQLARQQRPMPLIELKVNQLMAAMEEGRPLPPIDGYHIQANEWGVNNGFHRLEAARRLGHTHVVIAHEPPQPVLPAATPRYVPPHMR